MKPRPGSAELTTQGRCRVGTNDKQRRPLPGLRGWRTEGMRVSQHVHHLFVTVIGEVERRNRTG